MATSEQLRILSIGHYVVGGLHALFGCFGLIYLAIGSLVFLSPAAMSSGANNAPPAFMGIFFAAFGAAFVLFGWTLGFLTILSGRYIAERKNRTFSLVMGAVNCVMVPFGTVIGVFDIVLLTNSEVIKEYPPKPIL